ncbi:MAG TPA: glutamate-1-semialdehyde 2,1-aminomutase, partial [Streptosporangiaceae bacterium]|nr:glutamate-1-semialdehyde 2,1-aminomutase [Streptosporangiaceae bacterium]
RDGIRAQAKSHGLDVNYTGPVQMPYLTFAGDENYALGKLFAAEAIKRGAYIHPRHNWFVSAAMTDDDIAHVLRATDEAFAVVKNG